MGGIFVEKIRYRLWSPTGKPVAPSNTPVGRNPEQEPPAKAGLKSKGRRQSQIFQGDGPFDFPAGL